MTEVEGIAHTPLGETTFNTQAYDDMFSYIWVCKYGGRCICHYALTHGANQIYLLCNLPPALQKGIKQKCKSSDAAGRWLLLECETDTRVRMDVQEQTLSSQIILRQVDVLI